MKSVFVSRTLQRGLAALLCASTLAFVPACAVSTEERPPEVSQASPPVSALREEVQRALRAFPEARALGVEHGIPSLVRGTLGQGLKSGADKQIAGEQAALTQALKAIAPVFSLSEGQLMLRRQKVDERGHRHLRYQQTQAGLPVVGGELIVHVDETGRIYAVNGSARGEAASSDPKPSLSAESAQRLALAHDTAASQSQGTPRLVYLLAEHSAAPALAWEVRVTGEKDGGPVNDLVYVHAHRGAVLAVHGQIHSFGLDRDIYSSGNTDGIPGLPQRSEGERPTGDAHVDENYDLMAQAYSCFSNQFLRNSYDNAASPIKSTVHFLRYYANAFWSTDHQQFVFGDGDSGYKEFGRDPDVVIHEFTHAVTEYESHLAYLFESGALNESLSDMFAAFCSSAVNSWLMPVSTWTVGEATVRPITGQTAIRYMANPTQDGVSRDYYPSRYQGYDDYGGVHLNSGIPNLAFKLLSTGGAHPRGVTPNISVNGIGIEKAGRIFYEANKNWFTTSTTFAQAKLLTEQAAQALGYNAAIQKSVGDAWLAVGVGSGITAHLDGLDPKYGIDGWAFDRHVPNDALRIDYYVDGTWETGTPFSGFTTFPRTDVNTAFGLPASSTHGFILPIAPQYYDGAPHTLNIYAIDAQDVENVRIDDVEHTFTFAGAEGHVDEITSTGYVRGWALDLQSLGTSIDVHYYIGGPYGSGSPGFSVPTDQFRSDVNSNYGASGNHGFYFQVPPQFRDGYSRSLYVYAIDAQGRHNPLIDGHAYAIQVGTPPPPDPEPECNSGKILCECTNTCTTRRTCDKLCG